MPPRKNASKKKEIPSATKKQMTNSEVNMEEAGPSANRDYIRSAPTMPAEGSSRDSTVIFDDDGKVLGAVGGATVVATSSHDDLAELKEEMKKLETKEDKLETKEDQLEKEKNKLEKEQQTNSVVYEEILKQLTLVREQLTEKEKQRTEKEKLRTVLLTRTPAPARLATSTPIRGPHAGSAPLEEGAGGMQTICFFNGDDKEEPFFRVTCDLNGRMWSRLYLFMTSVCGHFDIKDYDIKQKDTNEIIDIAFDSLLLPGVYTITAKQSTSRQICVLDTYRESRIIPRQRRNSESQVSTPRTSTFKSQVTVRDKGACVITGDKKRAQACHIVAKAHWNNQENLPQSIKRLFISFPETINDVRNGLLLCPNLHGAFDDGDISIKYDSNANIYFVVAIDIAYQKLDGTLLWPPPTSLPLPHPDLLDFHLALSVMKHMCAAAEYDEDDPYSDFDIPQVQFVEAY